MLKKLITFHKDERGDLVQTGIIIALFAILAVGAIMYLGPKIKNLFSKTGSEIDKASNYSY